MRSKELEKIKDTPTYPVKVHGVGYFVYVQINVGFLSARVLDVSTKTVIVPAGECCRWRIRKRERYGSKEGERNTVEGKQVVAFSGICTSKV